MKAYSIQYTCTTVLYENIHTQSIKWMGFHKELRIFENIEHGCFELIKPIEKVIMKFL